MITAIQDRKIFKLEVVTQLAAEYFGRYAFSLGIFVSTANDANAVTHTQLAPQSFFKIMRVVSDQVVAPRTATRPLKKRPKTAAKRRSPS